MEDEIINRTYIVKKFGGSLYVPLTMALKRLGKGEKGAVVYVNFRDDKIIITREMVDAKPEGQITSG